MDKQRITAAAAALSQAAHVVCLTGAGVSAESGIATFRDAETGLWARFDPQQLASQTGFAADPGLVWQWYMARLATVETTDCNPGHVALAELEARLPSFTLVTQNVDNLHERAGSRNVLHVHGEITRFHCNLCQVEHALEAEERAADLPPICVRCAGPVRPAVIWFGEVLPRHAFQAAEEAAARCDVMLVVGTSGAVYPIAGLPHIAREAGSTLIDVNLERGPIGQMANFFLQGASGVVLPMLLAEMKSGQ